MITGGAPLESNCAGVSFFQLPGLMMDASFSRLAPSDPSLSLDEVKCDRAEKLYRFFKSFEPQVFLVELYPFGRKAFRFELDPVLEDIRKGELPPCLCLCSLRDILVERHDRDKFENRIITTLNSLFDGLLIHGDRNIIPLEETFNRVTDIAVPIAYTGYISPPVGHSDRRRLREKFHISPGTRLVVASIGGGNVGSELLLALVESLGFIKDESVSLQIFTGPYAPDSLHDRLKTKTFADHRIAVERFTPYFTDWLAAADLSVSMAGYNTTMNTLAAGTPALFYPFGRNREQSLRLGRLKNLVPLTVLEKDDLVPGRLADLVLRGLALKRFRSPVRLDGAQTTVNIVEQWQALIRK
jgi:predicted glycosyltransferase